MNSCFEANVFRGCRVESLGTLGIGTAKKRINYVCRGNNTEHSRAVISHWKKLKKGKNSSVLYEKLKSCPHTERTQRLDNLRKLHR